MHREGDPSQGPGSWDHFALAFNPDALSVQDWQYTTPLSAVEGWKLQPRNDFGERKTEKHEQAVMEVQISF